MHLWKENSQQGRAFQNLEILHVSQCSRLKKKFTVICIVFQKFKHFENIEMPWLG